MEQVSLIVTSWKTGNPSPTGVGYGIRFSLPDRNKYFKEKIQSAELKLPDGTIAEVNITDSFWNKCPEFRSKTIGQWLIKVGKAKWDDGETFKFKVKMIDHNRFELIE